MIVCCQKSIGGAVRGWGVGQIETDCQGDVRCRMLDMWVCERGEEKGTSKKGQGHW